MQRFLKDHFPVTVWLSAITTISCMPGASNAATEIDSRPKAAWCTGNLAVSMRLFILETAGWIGIQAHSADVGHAIIRTFGGPVRNLQETILDKPYSIAVAPKANGYNDLGAEP